MVKNWGTTVAPYNPYPGYSWVLNLYGDWNGSYFGGMVPAGTSFGDMTNGTGEPGQNSTTPSEKVFGAHYFISVAANVAPANQGPYFDPSYGVWYANQTDFQNKAVAYYAFPEKTFYSASPPYQALYTQWGVRLPTGTTNMCFATGTAPGSYGACN